MIFEASGNLKIQAQSVYYIRKGGTVVWFGCSPEGSKIEIDPFYINDAEISIHGSFNNPFATARAVQLLGSGKVQVDNLISHHIGIDDYLDVFKIFGGPDTLKLMVGMD